MIVEWNVTRLYTGSYVIRFWSYNKKNGLYHWKQLGIKSIHKLRDPKRLFLRSSCPYWSFHLNYIKDHREFEVTEEELAKGFLGIDIYGY